MSLADARREVAAMHDLRASFGDIAARTDDARRLALIQLRRALSEQMTHIADTCDPLFDHGPAAALVADYRHHLSHLRNAVAMHQANWPAVRIDDDPVAYRASALVARSTESKFLEWISTVLDALEGKGALPVPTSRRA